MGKQIGKGSIAKIDSTVIAALTKVGGLDISNEAVDSTTMEDTFDTIVAGAQKTGEITIEGYFDAVDSGQQKIETAAISQALLPLEVIFPNYYSFSFASALVTKYKPGDIDKNGLIPFSASFKGSGAPSINRSVSAGLTGLTASQGDLVPTFNNGVMDYSLVVPSNISSLTITPTFSAGAATISSGSANQSAISGQASSAIALGAAKSNTFVYITVQETGKIPKVYTIKVIRQAAA